MNFLYLSTLFFFLLSGCAGVPRLKSVVENDPTYTDSKGNRVIIGVLGNDGEEIDNTILGKTIKFAANEWFSSMGYKIVDHHKSADLVAMFRVSQKSEDVYVPGRTYSLPVYSPNNTNVLTPDGWQTHYREGYTATNINKWLFVQIISQVRGKIPTPISFGQVFPEYTNQVFFENQMLMNQAVVKALNQSNINDRSRAPASIIEDQDPGCWSRLGILFKKNKEETAGAEIENFDPSSNGEKAGLKIGDIVYKLGPHDVPLQKLVSFEESVPVSVAASRNGKTFRVNVKPTMLCVED